jgi:hypothetical protein
MQQGLELLPLRPMQFNRLSCSRRGFAHRRGSSVVCRPNVTFVGGGCDRGCVVVGAGCQLAIHVTSCWLITCIFTSSDCVACVGAGCCIQFGRGDTYSNAGGMAKILKLTCTCHILINVTGQPELSKKHMKTKPLQYSTAKCSGGAHTATFHGEASTGSLYATAIVCSPAARSDTRRIKPQTAGYLPVRIR